MALGHPRNLSEQQLDVGNAAYSLIVQSQWIVLRCFPAAEPSNRHYGFHKRHFKLKNIAFPVISQH